MADTQFVPYPFDDAPNPNSIPEPTHRPGAFLAWESSADYCREVHEVDNTAGEGAILPGTVLATEDGSLKGILFGLPLRAGLAESRTLVVRGPCIVRREKLLFPVVADIEGDAAATPPIEAVDGETATELLKIELEAALAAAGISIQ